MRSLPKMLAITTAVLITVPGSAQQSLTGCSADKIKAMRDLSVEKLQCECFAINCPTPEQPSIPEVAPRAPPQVLAPPASPLRTPDVAPKAPPQVLAPPAPPLPTPDVAPRTPPQVIAPPAPPSPALEVAPTVSPPGKTFRLHPGKDLDGRDFKVLRGVNQQDCAATCRNENACLAYTYDRWNRFCFLKASAPTELRVEPRSVSAVVSTLSPAISTKPVKTEVFRQRTFHDKGFQNTVEADYEGCRLRCERTVACEVFTFKLATRNCVLISQPGEHFKDPGADSGVRRQTP